MGFARVRTVMSFILGYLHQKVMMKFYENSKKLHFGPILSKKEVWEGSLGYDE